VTAPGLCRRATELRCRSFLKQADVLRLDDGITFAAWKLQARSIQHLDVAARVTDQAGALKLEGSLDWKTPGRPRLMNSFRRGIAHRDYKLNLYVRCRTDIASGSV
jgi:hypothetical protein